GANRSRSAPPVYISSPFSVLRNRRPPTYTLFPYTTLFRSSSRSRARACGAIGVGSDARAPRSTARDRDSRALSPGHGGRETKHRSEEHTSELQSPCNLVCRLLLEKKKQTSLPPFHTPTPHR